ncbi:MAG: hypothetical protein AAGA23_08160 [Pseudomonadota bacterium]
MNRANLGVSIFGAFLITSHVSADASRFTEITPEWQNPPYRQYDFWIGVGKANWRNKKPANFFHDDQGSPATHWVYPTLNGKVLLEFAMGDDAADAAGTRVQGFSVRYFDTHKQRWVMAQEWPGRNATNGVGDQLQGFYRFGRIQVFSTYFIGTPEEERTRRYTFSDIRPEGFIWHGVNTRDQGKTWSAGTLVEFSKIRPAAEWPKPGKPFPNYDEGRLCDDPAYRGFDALPGVWRGSRRDAQGKSDARLTAHHMLGGCAVMSFLEHQENGTPVTLLEVRSLSASKNDWWVYRLDSRPGTAHEYQLGHFEGGTISLYDNNQYVIEDELTNLTLSKIERKDANALKRTVWTTLSPNTLAFEWFERRNAEAAWQKTASFEFERISSGR